MFGNFNTPNNLKTRNDVLLKSAFERRSGYFVDMAQISGVAGREDVSKLMSNLQDLTKDKMSLVDTKLGGAQDLYAKRSLRKEVKAREAKLRSVESAYEDICGELLGLVASSPSMTNLRV